MEALFWWEIPGLGVVVTTGEDKMGKGSGYAGPPGYTFPSPD